MPLYLIQRTDDVDYDEYASVLIRAATAEEAMRLATRPITQEDVAGGLTGAIVGRPFYDGFRADRSNLTCTPIHEDGDPGEIIASFVKG